MPVVILLLACLSLPLSAHAKEAVEEAPASSAAPVVAHKPKPVDRLTPTLKGMGIGAGVGALLLLAVSGSDMALFFFAIPVSTIAVTTGAVLGFRSTAAAAARARAPTVVDGKPTSNIKPSLWSPLQLGVLLTSWVSTTSTDPYWHNGWAGRAAGESRVTEPKYPISFLSNNGLAASLTLLSSNAITAAGYHWTRPIGADGKRAVGLSRAGVTFAGGLIGGMIAPLVNYGVHGDTGLPGESHSSIWAQSVGGMVTGIVAADLLAEYLASQ